MDAKPYIVIARKYRPQGFEEVIGQDAVTTTLKNAISLGRIGHAYLFTGPRGVGKTSMARIFAKALNCKNGPTPNPCGKCDACLEIEGSRSLDVFEIDGASNRGIDEIRALRENVKFAPAAGKFKIYIIDEVHQVTDAGFNALLKTLEEPPAHVKFIFATTSVHKVPATILSRCQRFDFRRIPATLVAGALKEICKKEKIKIDEEALFAIAKAGDGSVRDSQSILDQIASSSGEKISKDEVIRSLGLLEEDVLLTLMDALADQDAKKAVLLLDSVLKEGKEVSLFMEKLLEHVRNLLFVTVSPDLADLVDASDTYKKALTEQKNRFSKEDLFYFFSVISHTLQIMKRFDLKRIPIEMALVKLAQRVPVEDISKIIEKIDSMEKKTASLTPAPFFSPPKEALSAAPAADEDESELPDVEDIAADDLRLAEVGETSTDFSLQTIWDSLLRALKTEKISVASYLAEGEPVSLANGVARVAFPEKFSFHRECLEVDENRKLIERHLSVLFSDKPVRIEFQSVKELSPNRISSVSMPAVEKPSPEAESAVKSAFNIFGGRVIKG